MWMVIIELDNLYVAGGGAGGGGGVRGRGDMMLY